MIDAGLPLVQGLTILAEQTENITFRNILKQITKDVEGGSTLAEAMKKHSKIFDDLFVKRNPNALDRYLHENYWDDDIGKSGINHIENSKEFLRDLFNRNPTVGVEVKKVIAKDNVITAFLKWYRTKAGNRETWMKGVRDRDLHERVHIMAGITPLKSAGMARYMQKKVPGMDVPDDLVKRLSAIPKEKQAEEGIKISLEAIERLKGIEGVRGFHIMAIEWEQKVPEIVERAGLLPRPQP